MQEPQPLHCMALTSTVFLTLPSFMYSRRVMALKGQVSTQKAQPSQFSSMGLEMMDSSSR